MKFISFIFLFLSFTINVFAQMPDSSAESANVLRQNGQIYLVVLVLITIFAGIIFMLIRLEKKISKLEKENTNNKIL